MTGAAWPATGARQATGLVGPVLHLARGRVYKRIRGGTRVARVAGVQAITDQDLGQVVGAQWRALAGAVQRFTTTYKQESQMISVFGVSKLRQIRTGIHDGWTAVKDPEYFQRRQALLKEFPFPYLPWRQRQGEVLVDPR